MLVNCAGGAPPRFFSELDLEVFDKTLSTNLRSAYCPSRGVWPYLERAGGGAIVNTASISGLWAMFGLSAYGAAKAAVVNLTRTMAIEGGPAGIRVNCVAPGYALSQSSQRMINEADTPEAFQASIADQSALGRMGSPSELASACLFLASTEASFITGHDLVVEGDVTLGQLPAADPRRTPEERRMSQR